MVRCKASVAGAPSLSGSWGPRWDHTLCALVNDLRVGARHARPPVGHILPATCGNALPPFSGGQVVAGSNHCRAQLPRSPRSPCRARSAVGLRLADPIPQRLGVDVQLLGQSGDHRRDPTPDTTGPCAQATRRDTSFSLLPKLPSSVYKIKPGSEVSGKTGESLAIVSVSVTISR